MLLGSRMGAKDNAVGAFTTTTSPFVVWLGDFNQERQGLWLSNDDLQDSASWSSPPLVTVLCSSGHTL